MIDNWESIFFTLCIGIPFITLVFIIGYLIYKVENLENKTNDDTPYEMFKEFGNDQSHSGKVQGFDVDENV
jgi:hypothetical protein